MRAYPYPNIRSALAEAYQDVADTEIESIVRAQAGMEAEDLENFLQTLGQIAQVAAPIVLPVVGTAIGGPVGAAVGTAAGSLVSGAIGGATRPQQQPSRPAPRPGAPAPSTPRPAGQPPSAAPAGGGTPPAVAQLATLLLRPEFLQAIASAFLGNAGRPTVPVGESEVPVGAFLNLQHVLGERAMAENHRARAGAGAGEEIPAYLVESDGAPKCDVGDPDARARVLLEMLRDNGEALEGEATEAEAWEWSEYDRMLDAYELSTLTSLEL